MLETRSFRMAGMVILLGGALAACSESVEEAGVAEAEGRSPIAGLGTSIEDRQGVDHQEAPVDWLRAIELEESQAVINVTPVVYPDAGGGFLVADAREAQIRRYSDDGKLVWYVGRRGNGPLEFRGPTVALRLVDGSVLVADAPSRLAVISGEGDELVSDLSPELGRVENAALLPSGQVLVGGLRLQAQALDPMSAQVTEPRLHVVDVGEDRIARSFFRPFADLGAEIAALAGSVSFAVRGSRIAATALPKDTVFLFDLDGSELGRVPMPSEHFRPIRPLDFADFQNPRKRTAWFESWESVTDIEWLSDTELLVQYRSIKGTSPVWHLLGMTIDGLRLFEWRDSPRLLAILDEGRTAVLESPNSMAPNKWSVVRFRR